MKKQRYRKKTWYLIAYDIRDPKRLSRTHYFIKKKGVGLQRSLFLINANSKELAEVIGGIQARVQDKDDDVRLYPVHKPGSIWAAGKQSEKFNHLYAPAQIDKSKSIMSRISKLFSRGK